MKKKKRHPTALGPDGYLKRPRPSTVGGIVSRCDACKRWETVRRDVGGVLLLCAKCRTTGD